MILIFGQVQASEEDVHPTALIMMPSGIILFVALLVAIYGYLKVHREF